MEPLSKEFVFRGKDKAYLTDLRFNREPQQGPHRARSRRRLRRLSDLAAAV